MPKFHITDTPFLQSKAHVYLMPINSHAKTDSRLLDTFNTMFAKNYDAYCKESANGTLFMGTCLLVKQESSSIGLSPAKANTEPKYIGNLVYNSHPRQTPRLSWLINALEDIQPRLTVLIKEQGVRSIALYAPPLFDIIDVLERDTVATTEEALAFWHDTTLPTIQNTLSDLPPVTIDIHIPKNY